MKVTTRQTYRIFWNHVKKYGVLASFMVFALVVATSLETIVPLFYKGFFDVLASSDSSDPEVVHKLTGIIVTIFIIYSVEWIFWRFTNYANDYFQPRVMADISHSTFEYLQKHSYSFFINRFVGSLVRRVNRLVHAFEGIADKLYWDLLPLAVRVVGILIVLFMAHPVIAWILFGWTVLYLAFNYAFSVYKLKYDKQRAVLDTKVTGQLADTVTNNINIKLFSAHDFESRSFKKILEKQFKLRKFTWNLGSHVEAVQMALMIILEFVIFYYAIRFWHKGILTIGDFVLIQAYLLQIFLRVWDFGRVIRDMYEHMADAEEMTEILNTPHDVADKPRAKKMQVKKGAIVYDDVGFAYNHTRSVLEGFNLYIRPGEKVGLVGPSGSGKSTLVALLFRYYDVISGHIRIDETDIADVTQDSLRKNISLVPQDPILFHRTLTDNIRYGRQSASEKEVVRAAKLAHCHEFIDRLPEKYNTFVGERGIKLSGGERQRVAIARVILKDAPILVLDEATSSLDSHSEFMIQDALKKLMKGKTTIVVAHRLSTIMKMDRILVIRNGAIEEQGTHQMLLEKKGGLYKKLWELQVGGFIS